VGYSFKEWQTIKVTNRKTWKFCWKIHFNLW